MSRLQPEQSAVDWTTLLRVLNPEYTVNGLPDIQITVPENNQPPMIPSTIAGAPLANFRPLPKGKS